MSDGVKKFGRTLWRDYLTAKVAEDSKFNVGLSILGYLLGGAAIAFASTLMVGMGSFLFGFGCVAAVAMAGTEIYGVYHGKTQNEASFDAAQGGEKIQLAGNGRSLWTIRQTQNLVRRLTAGFENAADLPESVQKTLATHIRDCRAAGASITATSGGETLDEIPFLRSAFNASSPVGAVLTQEGLAKHQGAYAMKEAREGINEDVTVRPIRLKKQITL